MTVVKGTTFLDSNVVLYSLSSDSAKADISESLLRDRPVISVQVLNEVTNVCRRKLGMEWKEIGQFLEVVRYFSHVVPLTVPVHDHGRQLAERHNLSFYDACIVAAAMAAGCTVLYTEDMSSGQRFGGELTLRNPFNF